MKTGRVDILCLQTASTANYNWSIMRNWEPLSLNKIRYIYKTAKLDMKVCDYYRPA